MVIFPKYLEERKTENRENLHVHPEKTTIVYLCREKHSGWETEIVLYTKD